MGPFSILQGPRSARYGRFFWLLCVASLGGMAWCQISSVSRETQTIDESNQLVTGYAYLRNGRYTMGLEHPPLLKLLFGIAIRDLHPDLPAAFPRSPRDANDLPLGTQFLYRNRVPADDLLMRGRLVAVGVSLALGFAIAFLAARWFGYTASLLALCFYALDPNFLAHGRYIKNDVAAALGILVVSAAWCSYLVTRKRSYLLLAGALLGFALSVKFSALALLPILLLHALIRRWQVPHEWPVGRIARSFTCVCAIAFVPVWAVYRFEVGTISSAHLVEKARKIERLRNLVRSVPILKGPLLAVANSVPLPAPLFFRGIVAVGHMNMVGRETYVLGNDSTYAPWYYSPVVLAVKTPAAVLGMLVAALILLWRQGALGPRLLNRVRAVPFVWLLLITTPLLYLSIAAVTRINSGVRSLLPAYPFVFILIGAVFATQLRTGRAVRLAVSAGLLGILAESILIYPHYLTFFNVLAGGPSHGPKYLLDSNIDWGQGVKYLRSYVHSHRVENLCLSYYGAADLPYYGISFRPLPEFASLATLRKLDCTVAVSVTNLYNPQGQFASLRALEPKARIANSIYVYDR
jgi:hypothetical protein